MRVICSYIKPLAVGCKEKVRVEFGHLEELLQNGKMASVGKLKAEPTLWINFG